MKLIALRRIQDTVGAIEQGCRFQTANDREGHELIESGSAIQVGTNPAAKTGRWAGATCVVIASGPSLNAFDCEAVRQWRAADPGARKVIVINSSYRLAPWADALYACDEAWWIENLAAAKKSFEGEFWTQSTADVGEVMNRVVSEPRFGLGRIPGVIHQGGNSGYQAINLAYQWGAHHIVLLGFDMAASAGRKHWHAPHAKHVTTEHDYAGWNERFWELQADLLEDGVSVVNASRSTALTQFPRVPLSLELGTAIPQTAPAAAAAGHERPAPAAVYIRGMHGLGDNLHQRAVVRQMHAAGIEVWLDTPWPALYHDLAGDRMHLISSGSGLRTQAKNVRRESGVFEQLAPPVDAYPIEVGYTGEALRKNGSILAAMTTSARVSADGADFRLPVPAAWETKAAALTKQWNPGRPLLIYRPLVERSEWGGNAPRNADPQAYVSLFRAIRDRFFVVSVADLAEGEEWVVSEDIGADVTLHKGELDIETLAALVKQAAMVWTSSGFAVILAQAVGTPVISVFGGYEDSRSFSAGAAFAPYLGIDPVNPCQCFSHEHRCDKRIDILGAESKIAAFVNTYSSPKPPPPDVATVVVRAADGVTNPEIVKAVKEGARQTRRANAARGQRLQ
jgi:hypothetical protein